MRNLAAQWGCHGRLAVATLAWAFGCWQLTAALTNVNIGLYGYNPSAVAINVNDQVQWTWLSDYHSVTSSQGLWDSGLYNSGFTYTLTFTNAGTFPYYCSFHYFDGSVTVQSANLAPTVTITNPPNGAVLSAPATLVLGATAADPDGSVTNVEFFQGSTSLSNVAAVPFSIPVNGLPAGNYAFTAVATDEGGLTATNAITVQVITPAALMLTAPQRLSGTVFEFSYAADVGLRYVVERSADLKSWVGIETNTAASNPVVVRDSNVSEGGGFYRVWRLPNP